MELESMQCRRCGEVESGKDAIRRDMRARRRAVPACGRVASSAAVCAKLLARAGAVGCAHGAGPVIAVYLASPDEIDIGEYIGEMLARRARLAAPRWNGETYELAVLKGMEARFLRRGPMGIMEPADGHVVSPRDVSVWIVPGLAFTRDGRRLGYGGGWYDRFLASASDDSIKLGVAYSFQVVEDIPVDSHDIQLDAVVDDMPM